MKSNKKIKLMLYIFNLPNCPKLNYNNQIHNYNKIITNLPTHTIPNINQFSSNYEWLRI